MAQKPRRHKLSKADQLESASVLNKVHRNVGSGAAYMVIDQAEFPKLIPESLREKCENAVIMTSDLTEHHSVMAINLRRWDTRDSAVDQEILAISFVDGQASSEAVFIHHGNWEGRTEKAQTSESCNSACASPVISDFVVLKSLPQKSQGPLSDLEGYSDRRASRAAWDELYRSLDDNA